MGAGDRGRISSADPREVDRAIRQAEQTSRCEFSVFVGSTEGHPPREFAARLHRSLVVPDRSVVVLVDPSRRAVEVITGQDVRRTLSDAEVELVVGQMREYFAQGDLTAGLVRGISQLAEHARAPRTLHAR